MSSNLNWAEWRRFKAAIEACLREGFTPIGVPGGKGSSVGEAARRLKAAGHMANNTTNARLAQWCRVQEKRKNRGIEHCLPDWSLYNTPNAVKIAPTSRVRERWLLTAAQNDTKVHKPFWKNLLAFASYLGARVYVGRFTYQVAVAKDRARVQTPQFDKSRDYRWEPELEPYLTSERFHCGGLIFCAEMNTLPTAVRPLSGLHTYGQGKTAIFPHAKIALEMVPTGEGLAPAVLTTGCCTVPSYTDTKSGLKGEFHHVQGAVIVEIDDDDNTFFRHIIAKTDGTFQDLDILVKDGKISTGNRVEAITWGDIQSPFLDPMLAMTTWGFDVEKWERTSNGLVDDLRPHYGFYHDLIDFKSISYWEEKMPLERYKTFLRQGHLVQGDIDKAASFVTATERDFMKRVVVESNHDKWLERWLDRCDHRKDRDNALSFLTYEYARFKAIAEGDTTFNVWRHALNISPAGKLDDVMFIPEGGTFVICPETGGIECGTHGHLGPDGQPASPNTLAKVTGKANIGHRHSPIILDGLYGAGTSSVLRLGYNKGPSSWAHCHTVVYPTGKRTLLFVQNGRWRA